jgi:hypothetical protein
MIRDDIAKLLIRQMHLQPQAQPQEQLQQRPIVPKPFLPQVPPVRSLPPTMIGTPPKIQQAAIQDYLGQAQRMVDPPDVLDPDGSSAIGKALKKLFANTGTEGSGAP